MQSVLWIMDLTSGRPINPAQVWVYFSWTHQTSHEIRILLTDSWLNNKSPFSLSKMLSCTAVQINPGISSGTQAIVPCDRSLAFTTATGVNANRWTTQSVSAPVHRWCDPPGPGRRRTSGWGTRGSHSLQIKRAILKRNSMFYSLAADS